MQPTAALHDDLAHGRTGKNIPHLDIRYHTGRKPTIAGWHRYPPSGDLRDLPPYTPVAIPMILGEPIGPDTRWRIGYTIGRTRSSGRRIRVRFHNGSLLAVKFADVKAIYRNEAR